MTDEADDIGYKGPPRDIGVGPGANQGGGSDSFRTAGLRTYADRPKLEQDLNRLINFSNAVISDIEDKLSTYALPVRKGELRLAEANKVEWPTSLGNPSELISYRYYKALKNRNTNTATYIRHRWEDAARDITGFPSLDVLSLISTIRDEALLVKEFLVTYVGKVDDTSEYRTLELFQDWTSTASYHAQRFATLDKEGVKTGLPASEVDNITPLEARNAQAVFKVKLNTLNKEVSSTNEFIQKNFSQYSPMFYGRVLGPALRFRLGAGRKVFPTEGVVGSAVSEAVGGLNTNLAIAQADQLRRNLLFDAKMNDMQAKLEQSVETRNFIQELGSRGKLVTTSSLHPITEDESEALVFEAQQALSPTAATPTSEHNKVTGRDALDAHDQYLLRSGGIIIGDILVEDSIKIDGVDLSAHLHTGEDGSPKIPGTSILEGTLVASAIDVAVPPETPSPPRITSSVQRIIPPGMTVYDVNVAWDGDDKYTYEVQITAVPV